MSQWGKPKRKDEIPLNPFFQKTHLTIQDQLRILLLTIFLVPIRIIGIVVLVLITWAAAASGVSFMTPIDREKPFNLPRRIARFIVSRILIRGIFFIIGFHWVEVKGKRVNYNEAPILVGAPHSSFIDVILLAFLNAPSIVAKAELRKIPFYGNLLDISQAVCVQRGDSNSQNSTLLEISRRATQKVGANQLLIYPEGTTTNREGLVKFKSGAFVPKVPVQPVLLKYKSTRDFDPITWTFIGTNHLVSIWYLLTTFSQKFEIEFLPPYIPSEAERNNPALYAENVSILMAKKLGIPLTDYSIADGLAYVKLHKILKNQAKLTNKFKPYIERIYEEYRNRDKPLELHISHSGISNLLKCKKEELEKFLCVFDWDGSSPLLLPRLIFSSFVSRKATTHEIINLLMKTFEGKTHLTREEFSSFMKSIFEIKEIKLFTAMARLSQENSLTTIYEVKVVLRKLIDFGKLLSQEIKGELKEYPIRKHIQFENFSYEKKKMLYY